MRGSGERTGELFSYISRSVPQRVEEEMMVQLSRRMVLLAGAAWTVSTLRFNPLWNWYKREPMPVVKGWSSHLRHGNRVAQ